MSVINDYLKLVRPYDYDQEYLNEQASIKEQIEYSSGIKNDAFRTNAPIRKLQYGGNLAKKIICECVTNLYMSSLIIDEPEKYSESLKEAVESYVYDELSECATIADLKKKYDKPTASTYLKGMISLAETAMKDKTDDDFSKEVVLSKEDLKLINNFEKVYGKDTYATDLQDRIIDVFKAEQKMSEDYKDKVTKIVDAIAENNYAKRQESDAFAYNDLLGNDEPVKSDDNAARTKAIEESFNLIDPMPKSLFSAIYMNKSKQIINENAGVDISSVSDDILYETICTYTLLECVHAIGLHAYTKDEREHLKMSFFTGKVQ